MCRFESCSLLMRLKVRQFRDKAYHLAVDIYQEKVDIEDFWEEFTGEVIGVDINTSKAMICRDDTGKLEIVSTSDCIKE